MVCKTFLFTLSILISLDFTSHISASSWHFFQLLPFFTLSAASHFFCTPPLSSCQIDWHKGKDVTVKTIKKKQKHKGRGTVRTVTKQVPNDSFFNFFNPVKGENTPTNTQNVVDLTGGLNATFKAICLFLSTTCSM